MKRMSNKDADRALRALEQRVPEMDDAALDALNAQAYEKFMQRRKRRGRMHRRIAAVCAATLGILVVSFGFSVLMPNKIGQANNGVKKVALWFGEKLHLDLKFDQPVDDEPLVDVKTEKTFFSIDKALEELKIPIVGFKKEARVELEKIEIATHSERQYLIKSIYSNNNEQIVLYVECLSDQTTAAVLAEQQIKIATPLGDAICWSNEEGSRAVLYSEQYSIQVTSNMILDDFMETLGYLKLFIQL